MQRDPEHGNAQYDYAYSNEELETDDERKIKFLAGLKNVVGHTATKIAMAGSRMGGQTRMPTFNERLAMHNGFNAPNPFANRHPTVNRGAPINRGRVLPRR